MPDTRHKIIVMGRGRPQYYVDSITGNDTTGNGSQVSPWATITKAVATVPDTGVDINVAAGTYVENTSGLKYLYLTRAFTKETRVKGVGAVTLTDAASGTYVMHVNGSSNLHFQNLTIVPAGDNTQPTVFFQNAAVQNVWFTSCVIRTLAGTAGRIGIQAFGITVAMTGIRFTSCVVEPITGTASMRGVLIAVGASGNVEAEFNNCIMPGNGGASTMGYFEAKLYDVAGAITIAINGGTYTNTNKYAVLIHGGNARINGATVFSSSAPALVIGADGPGTYTTQGWVANSSISSTSSHALLIGGSSSAIACYGNTIAGGDYTLVVKRCANAEVYNNTITGGSASTIHVKGATGANIHHNSIASSAGICVQAIQDGDGTDFGTLTLNYNTVVATGSASIFSWAGVGQDSGGGICDYNTYNIAGTSGNLGTVRAASGITNLAGLQAAWAGYDNPNNDANSTVT